MSDLIEHIRQITERIQNLNNSTIDSDPFNKFKRMLAINNTFPINIKSIHEGDSRSSGKITLTDQNIKFDMSIDDILDNEIANLSFRIINFDLKVINNEILGIVIQDDNVPRIEKISLIYLNDDKQYMINIHSNRPFNSGKIFISFSKVISLNNFDPHSHMSQIEQIDEEIISEE